MSVGRSDCSIIKTHILFPPPLHFSKISFFFWTSSLPPKNKLQMQTQIRRLFSDDKQKTDKMTCIFSSGDDYKSDTLLTPCWSFFQMCNCTIVTTWHSFAMPFFHCQMFSCKVDNTFSPVAMTKYFPLTSLMFTAIVELSISTLIFVKKVWEQKLNLTNHFHTSIWW